MLRLALFTDLDDTLLGITKAHQQATQRIITLLRKKNIDLFAVTGRRLTMIEDSSPFTGLACEVGTQIYLKTQAGKFRLDKAYDRYVKKTSGFQYASIHRLCKKVSLDIQNKFPNIHFQFQPLKQKFKISFTFTSTARQSFTVQHLFEDAFKQTHYPKIQVILTAGATTGTKRIFYLDVVAVGKEIAVAYLAKKYHYQPIVAGDGGNDIAMLLKTPWPAIIVGGYKPELRKAIQASHKKNIYVEPPSKKTGPVSLLCGLKKTFLY